MPNSSNLLLGPKSLLDRSGPSPALQFHRLYDSILLVLSLIANIPLLYLIRRRTRPEMANYKIILFLSALTDLFFTIVNAATMQCILIDEGTIIFVNMGPLTNIPEPYAIMLSTVYCFSITATYTTSAFQFLYRFNGLVRRKAMGLKMMLGIYGGMLAMAASVCCFGTFALEMVGDAANRGEQLLLERGFWLNGKVPVYSVMEAQSWGILGLLFHITYCSLCYSAVFYFAIRIHHSIRNTPPMSTVTRSAQRQINYILAAQCLIPVVMVNLPAMVVCSTPLLHLRIPRIGEWMVRLAGMIPILNAASIILIVRSYRLAVFRSLLKWTGVKPLEQSTTKQVSMVSVRTQL